MYAACLIGKLGALEVYASIMEIKENYFEATVLSMNINVRVYVNIVCDSSLNIYILYFTALDIVLFLSKIYRAHTIQIYNSKHLNMKTMINLH